MKYSKDYPPKRGDFVTSDCVRNNAAFATRRYREREKALELEHPEWAETFKAAGSVSNSARLKQLTTEREALSARLDAVGQRIAEVRKKFT